MKKGIVLLFIITIIILSMPQYAYSAPNSHKKVIVLIVDNINYNDLINYGGENINYLLKNGALGLMNTNSGGSYTDSNGYATIGAGAYAVSTSIGGYAGGRESLFNQEPINEVYERNTGRKQKEGNIANIDILGLTKQNEKLNRPVKIGLLGTLLNEHGYKTALIGNESTTFDDVNVKASLISMNGEGITNLGIVDKSLIIKDFMSPFGIKTDYKALYDAYKKVKDRADFIVIQTGDTHRLNKYMNISDERHKKNKTNIFAEIDELLGKIMKNNDKDTLLMLVVPFPSNDDILNGNRLTPVITFSKSLQKGILTSATTKRDGVITNTDLATHVLAYFQIPKDSLMTGHEVTSKDVGEPLKYLLKLNEISVFNYKIRSAVVKTYISYIIAVFLATFVFMVYFKNTYPI